MKSIRHFINRLLAGIALVSILTASLPFTDAVLPGTAVSYAVEDYMEQMEQRKTLPIQSNAVENWPQGPAIGAESAILMEMNTHTILYAKNIHEKNYPASTTKILTCLLAMQNCTMDETITFSHDSIYDVPGDGSRLGGVDTGDTMPMEQALYCVLVQSANEVASAVGEHVAEKLGKEKSTEAFAELMNEKVASLGGTDSHFTNCNGLFDENHYTSAYDLALVGCEFFKNEQLCKMSSTPSYHFRLKPDDEEDVWIASKNQLYKGKPYEYQYLLGSKTGFVSQSRQTLVSAAEKNGMKLVCVIFMDETPYQFEDTITLFQYGFENFQRVSIKDHETRYNIDTMDFFDTENDLFGDSTPLISIENDTYVILPNTADFSDTVSTLTYEEQSSHSNVIASISYTYSDVPVGGCNLVFYKSSVPAFRFGSGESAHEVIPDTSKGVMVESSEVSTEPEEEINVIYIDVKKVIIGIVIAAVIIVLILFVISVINNYSFSPRGQSSKRRRNRRREIRAARREARRRARWRNPSRRILVRINKRGRH
ncbi:MAG: D-alanyl-D-alanine carboxypeptidase [Lachnospiraceae bacterium]|nr:D-alanyl-D-alanine carboxypeptidase [Lachnospiraceae bacterium]